MESSQKKKRILLLMAGPKFDLEWEFGDRLQSMSEFSSGELVTTSSTKRTLEIGDFVIRSTEVGRKTKLRSRIVYLVRCIKVMRLAAANESPIELVVTYDPLASGMTGLILSWLFDTKLVCEVNGDYASTANYRHIVKSNSRRFKRKLLITIARFVLRRADGIKLLFDQQLDRLAVEPKKSQVVSCFPNYVNIGAFRNLGEERTVLLVGFPLYVKGTDIAIRAFRRIEQQHPEWTLKIMGFYPDRSELNELIGDSRQILVQKPVLHKYVNEHVGRCGVLLQPSRTEGMGRVLIEAMAAGKPLVSTNIDGVPNVIEDGKNGFLVPMGDVERTAEVLDRLMKDSELRTSLGSTGVGIANSKFAPDVYFRRLNEFYDSVVGQRTAA